MKNLHIDGSKLRITNNQTDQISANVESEFYGRGLIFYANDLISHQLPPNICPLEMVSEEISGELYDSR